MSRSQTGSAERSRRYRRRQRHGLKAVTIEVPEWAVVSALINRGHLAEEEALDPGLVAAALGRVLVSWASAGRK